MTLKESYAELLRLRIAVLDAMLRVIDERRKCNPHLGSGRDTRGRAHVRKNKTRETNRRNQ